MLTEAEACWLKSARELTEVGKALFWDDCDAVADALAEKGYIKPYDAGYVDWYGCWVTVTPEGWLALQNHSVA